MGRRGPKPKFPSGPMTSGERHARYVERQKMIHGSEEWNRMENERLKQYKVYIYREHKHIYNNFSELFLSKESTRTQTNNHLFLI